MAYVKLFGSILASTIWSEAATTRIVWITMLALANRDGIVEGSLPGLAHLARVSDDECRRALLSLSGPDPESRTKSYDGRRIADVDGGWLILNYELYRDKQTKEDVKEAARLRQQRKRARDGSRLSLPSQSVAPVTHSSPMEEEGAAPDPVTEEIAAALLRHGIFDSAASRRYDLAERLAREGGSPTLVDDVIRFCRAKKARRPAAMAVKVMDLKVPLLQSLLHSSELPPTHPQNMPVPYRDSMTGVDCQCGACAAARAKAVK